jgi:hypothetical protein
MPPVVEEPDLADVPTTSDEAEARLRAWEAAVRRPGQQSFLRIRRDDRGALTIRADAEALRRRRGSLELAGDRLRLAVNSRAFVLPLRHFDAVLRHTDKWVLIEVKPRAGETAVQRELAGEVLKLVSESAHDDYHVALLRRVFRAVTEVTEDVEVETVADALSAGTDLLAVVRLFEQPEAIETLKQSDPLAPARLRGIEAREKLIDLAGGTLSGEEVARALGLTRQAVDKRRRSRRLFAISLGKRGHRYPAFQLTDGRPLPGLDAVLAALRGHDAWTQLAFFVNGRPDLNGRSPIDALRRGDVHAVLRAAATVGEHGAA